MNPCRESLNHPTQSREQLLLRSVLMFNNAHFKGHYLTYTMVTNHPSMHPHIFFQSFGTGSRLQQSKQRYTDFPGHFLQLLNWLLSMWRGSISTLSSLQVTELLNLLLRERPATHRRRSFQPLVVVILFFWSRPRGYDHR